ncbi:hypothetical protein Taro_027128 [Colocasia esculenta]|uniref:Gfo/Idh/MocA-like oxidoreductase N-terminal domain-containing protein n=1 Tax=Colocasia esculenta TaxID=4460 RepID=A0A843V7X2_COLES|nr:hypothetical protein [Colocasia esculenta]
MRAQIQFHLRELQTGEDGNTPPIIRLGIRHRNSEVMNYQRTEEVSSEAPSRTWKQMSVSDTMLPHIALLGAGIFVRTQYIPRLRELVDYAVVKTIWSRTEESARAAAVLTCDFSPNVDCKWGEAGLDDIIQDRSIHGVAIILAGQVQVDVALRMLKAGKHVIQGYSPKIDCPLPQRTFQWLQASKYLDFEQHMEKKASLDRLVELKEGVGRLKGSLLDCEPSATSEAGTALSEYSSFLNNSPQKPIWALAENYRFEPAFVESRKLMKNIGEMMNIQVIVEGSMNSSNPYFSSSWRRKLHGGFILDMGVHFIAGLRMVAGCEISTVSAVTCYVDTSLPPPDNICALFQLENGCPGVFVMTVSSPSPKIHWRFVGSKGTLQVERGNINGRHGYSLSSPTTIDSYVLSPHTTEGNGPAMATATHIPGVVFGPLVVQDHIRNGYLTTPTRFGAFPPVVESPYFLGVIPAVIPTVAKAQETSKTKEEPQAQEANLVQMFTTYAINFTNTPTTKKHRKHKYGKKPTTRGISSSGKTVRIGELRIRLDGSETMVIPERQVATIPVRNKFGILPKVQQDKPSFKVKEKKKQWVKAETQNPKPDKFGFRKHKANIEKEEGYNPSRVKQMWVTKEEAQELRRVRSLESLIGRKNARGVMKQDPAMWQNFRRRKVHERQREPSQESRTKESTPPQPAYLQRGYKRKGVYQERRRQASPETGQNFMSEEHERDGNIPRISVFQRLGPAARLRQKKRRTVKITEEGVRVYTCYASNINLLAIADQVETSNTEQHPATVGRRREQARAWLDRVNTEGDLPLPNEGGAGVTDIATTSNHPLDQGRPNEGYNIRVSPSLNLETVMLENQKLKAMLESLMQQLGVTPPQLPQPSLPPQPVQQVVQPQQLQQAAQPIPPIVVPQLGNAQPSTPRAEFTNPNSSHEENQEVHVAEQRHGLPPLNTTFEGTMVSQRAMIEQIIEAKMAEQSEGSATYDLYRPQPHGGVSGKPPSRQGLSPTGRATNTVLSQGRRCAFLSPSRRRHHLQLPLPCHSKKGPRRPQPASSPVQVAPVGGFFPGTRRSRKLPASPAAAATPPARAAALLAEGEEEGRPVPCSGPPQKRGRRGWPPTREGSHATAAAAGYPPRRRRCRWDPPSPPPPPLPLGSPLVAAVAAGPLLRAAAAVAVCCCCCYLERAEEKATPCPNRNRKGGRAGRCSSCSWSRQEREREAAASPPPPCSPSASRKGRFREFEVENEKELL